jgi:glycosyltransferase involved in cell wall biosynthesis
MVPNEGLRQSLGEQGFRRLLVVGRGVDSAQFSPAWRSEALRAQWGVRADESVILSVGRLAAEKNFELLAKAWSAMQAAKPRLRLVIVGDGPMRDAVRRMFPQAVMAGMRRGADLAAHYASADGFVFPSTTETYGNVLPEAMASGLPVVAYDYAAASEWVHSGVNGWAVPMDDESAFVQACVRVWCGDSDVSAWRKAARQTACQRDWASIVSQVEQHWRHLLARESLKPGPFAVFHSG